MLKIDLLPRQFAIARTNKKWIGIFAVLLAVVVLGFFIWFGGIGSQIEKVQADVDEVKPIADEVRALRSEKQSKEADLQPIKDKLQFIAQADRSVSVYWDRFHAINKYIWDRAQVSAFTITPPDTVQFTVTIHGTQEAGRFVLNLLRCPALTNISISGLPAGKSVEGEGGVTGPSRGGFGAPGMPGRPGGPPRMPERPGGPAGPGPMVPGPMAPPGGPFGLGAQPGVTTETAEVGSPEEEIIFQVTATLTEPINAPQLPGTAVAGGMGMPGMGPPGMGPPGMGPPGMGPPGPGAEEPEEDL